MRRGWATPTRPGDGGKQGFGEMGGGAATQLSGATRWPGEKLSAASRLPGGRCGDPGARRRLLRGSSSSSALLLHGGPAEAVAARSRLPPRLLPSSSSNAGGGGLGGCGWRLHSDAVASPPRPRTHRQKEQGGDVREREREREICPHPPRSTLMRASWGSSAAAGASGGIGARRARAVRGEEHRAAGRKLRPPLKGEIRLAAAMWDEAAEVRDRGAGWRPCRGLRVNFTKVRGRSRKFLENRRSGPFASPIRRMGIAGDVAALAGLLLVHESY